MHFHSIFSMNILTSFGLKLKKIRNSKDLSQEKLAEITGLHRTYISSLERGNRNPTLLTLQSLSKALDMSVDELIEGLGDT